MTAAQNQGGDVAYLLRLTVAEREQLKAEAGELDLSLQQLLERRIFGKEKPRRTLGRPRKRPQAEELRLTG